MSLPEPVQGLVIRYSYLWHSEAQRGQEEGRKDRPCAVVLSSKQVEGKTRVMVAPITHTPPARDTAAVEVPPKVCEHLRLDGQKSWIITAEVNVFTWPGPDLRPAHGKEFSFGHLPRKLALQVRDNILDRTREQVKTVSRDWDALAKGKPTGKAIYTKPAQDKDRDRDR